jgi:hypothetical protein
LIYIFVVLNYVFNELNLGFLFSVLTMILHDQTNFNYFACSCADILQR